MAFHSAAYRPLTPITPLHSPHPSTSSVRSRTPGQLSLHEYRKHQATPSPPAIAGQRTIRKKCAVSSLKRVETSQQRAPLQFSSPSPPPSPPPALADDFARSLNFSSSYRPIYPEFQHLSSPFAQPQSNSEHPFVRQSPLRAQTVPAIVPPFVNDLPFTGNLNSSQSNAKFTAIKGSFKTNKRLPHPKEVRNYQSPELNNFISSASCSYTSLVATGLTSTSSFSLSRFEFPDPPQAQPRAGPVTSTSISLHSHFGHHTPPATPTILQYRGASFDLLNPHASLYLAEIRTPAEPDNDSADYFDPITFKDCAMADSDETSSQRSDAANKGRRFNDLASAHAAIACNVPVCARASPSKQRVALTLIRLRVQYLHRYRVTDQ